MKDKTRLAIWLGSKNKDYQEGLSIYKDLAVNTKRNTFLTTMVPTKVHENMLLNDLQRWARIRDVKPMNPKIAKKMQAEKDAAFKKIIKKQKAKTNPPVDAEKFVESRRVEIIKNPKILYDKLPEDLKLVYDGFKGLYEQFDTKRSAMNELPETKDFDKQRKTLAGEVVGLRNTIRFNWEKIDKWYEELKKGGGTQKTENQPEKASGALSKAQIEKIVDPEIKVLSKKLRIEANLKYIGRNAGIAKKEKEVKARMTELDEWEVSYAAINKKDSAGGISV